MYVSTSGLVSIGTVSWNWSGISIIERSIANESSNDGAFATSGVSKE